MLYKKLVAKLERLNGDYFDPAILDTALTWSENIGIAKRHHLITCNNEDDIPP